MRLSHNILANYVSQIYTSLIGILILPLYLGYMGAEAFGLIGFYTLLQTWFNILDMGLIPSVARETARFHAGAIPVLSYRNLLRALQLIFSVVMMLGLITLFLLADYLAHSWLKIQTLPIGQVQTAIQLMAFSIALRWMSSLYRAIITGSEQFVWLSAYSVVLTTLRYIGVLGVLMYVGVTPVIFYTYQLAIALLELLVFSNKVFKGIPILPSKESPADLFPSLVSSVRSIAPFAVTIAFTTPLWILITQTDKLILSKSLSLTEYGYFCLAVIAASSVGFITSPISLTLIPRMVRLKAEGDEKGMLSIYRQATKRVALIVMPVTVVFSLYPEKILWIWTNNLQASQAAAPALRLYALGNALLTFAGFAYYLQYAYGKLKLHLLGSIIFVCALIPEMVWAAPRYGMLGAGWIWFLNTGLWLLLWVPFIHSRFAKGLHWKWLFEDIGSIICSSCLAGSLIYFTLPISTNRTFMFLEITLLAVFISITSLLTSYQKRYRFRIYFSDKIMFRGAGHGYTDNE
jgi:O-antigen/teichoic acid export membrane protein